MITVPQAAIDRTLERLKVEEGFRATPYRDQFGNETVGYGTNLAAGISKRQAEAMAAIALGDVRDQLGKIGSYRALSEVRKSVLDDMGYNLGIDKLMGFHGMWRAINAGDFEKAAAEMLDSAWARQVPSRAQSLAAAMKGDAWPT